MVGLRSPLPPFLDKLLLTMAVTALTPKAFGIYLDGKGHYAVRGEARQHPDFNTDSSFQAIDQFFRMEAELRSSDRASFFLEFGLFEDPKKAFMGDSTGLEKCSPLEETANGTQHPSNVGNDSGADCAGRHQNSTEPRYQTYLPRIRKAYAQYAADSCLFTVGRRGRDWGMGLILDSGEGIFDESASVYDGVTCDINIQKLDRLGFSVGYDKIVESGTSVDFKVDDFDRYGATNQGDDLDQFFLTIEYDTTGGKTTDLQQKIGIYFANIMGQKPLKTDLKIADLYLNFLTPSFEIEQEFVFRLGKTTDPSFTRLGGRASKEGEIYRNSADAIGLAGRFAWIFSESGSLLSPKEYGQGNLTRHLLEFDYAYAPGDKDGYTPQYDELDNPLRTNTKAEAMAFHKNFKPTKLLLQNRTGDRYRVDGIFEPERVMNTTVFGLSYKYESVQNGNFTMKLATGLLNQGITQSAKDAYLSYQAGRAANEALDPSDPNYLGPDDPYADAPIGYKGKSLGWELALSYDMVYDKGFKLGGALAMGLPGDAFHVESQGKPESQYLVQAYTAFTF